MLVARFRLLGRTTSDTTDILFVPCREETGSRSSHYRGSFVTAAASKRNISSGEFSPLLFLFYIKVLFLLFSPQFTTQAKTSSVALAGLAVPLS